MISMWSSELSDSVQLYWRFLVDLVEESNINYDGFPSDPVAVSKALFADPQMATRRDAELTGWWKYIDDNGYTRDFESTNSIMARLAVEIISAAPECVDDYDELSERLTWALKFTSILHVDEKLQWSILNKHFDLK